MSDKLPTGPGCMPSATFESNNSIRNALRKLESFQTVSIEWRKNTSISEVTGETHGEWTVFVQARGGKDFEAEYYCLLKALWWALEQAENSDSEFWKKRDEARQSALAKLTPEDKKVLRLA